MEIVGKSRKRTSVTTDEDDAKVDLFSHMNSNNNGVSEEDDDDDDNDSTDSEESEYSGLSDDEESSDAESFEEFGDESESDECQDMEFSAGGEEVAGEESEDDSEEEAPLERVEKEAKIAATQNNKNNTKSLRKIEHGKHAQSSVLSEETIGQETQPSTTSIDNTASSSSAEITGSKPDEYEFDSSDEEDIRNTVGNIPMEWYREYEHIGYNLDGKKIIRPPQNDQLDDFLSRMDNPDYWRTVVDKSTGQNVVLSEKDCEMIQRFRKGKYVDSKVDQYAPWIDFFTYEKMQHPITNAPPDKRSFVPSKWERIKVGRMVHAIKMGWMKPYDQKKEDAEQKNEEDYYMLWKADEEPNITKQYLSRIPAPKLALPGHAESYNPPPEYLFSADEVKKWRKTEKEDRRMNFIPIKYDSLRTVPAFNNFIKERFERCLDLYLCPRQRRMRMQVNPEDLLPKLPRPKDLQPFPTVQSVLYKGHTHIVRCLSLESKGQWFVSGSDDETIKFWEISTGRCMKTLHIGGVVKGVAWNPNPSLCLVAALVGKDVVIVNPGLGDKLVISNTDNLLKSCIETDETENDKTDWILESGDAYNEGFRIRINHFKEVSHVSWHSRGDYLSVVISGGESKSVVIHQLSKRRSQNPFSKSKGLVQCVLFHPTRPFLFVATQRYVRVYNLLKQELSKKLMTNVKWVSSMAIHPGGDNLIIGSYDTRLSWFDLDLSTKPYQMLKHHKQAIRQVCYHKKYPLFASASDDGTVIVCHGKVYNDLLKNPLIVPVKVLKGHRREHNLGVLGCEFHPTQPWIISCGSDHTLRLYT